MTDAADAALRLCLAGTISPQVALARLLLAGLAPAAIGPCLDALAGAARRPEERARAALLRRVFDARRDGLGAVSGMLAAAGLDHADTLGAAAVSRIAAMFDRAVAHAPEASVAAYSLNDPATLAAATAEIVAWLSVQGLLGPGRAVLDLGCGIGRVAAALAPLCGDVLGLDVSAGMVAEARRRHGSMPGLRFATTPGTGLAALAGQGFDLVLAVDSLPYLVQAGLAERQVAELAGLLRPGGALAILNLSYRGDPSADRADAARWAAAHGLALTVDGVAPFALWDGVAWLLRRG